MWERSRRKRIELVRVLHERSIFASVSVDCKKGQHYPDVNWLRKSDASLPNHIDELSLRERVPS